MIDYRARLSASLLVGFALMLAGCGGRGGGAALTPPASSTVQIPTAKSVSPGSIPVPPMAKTPPQPSSAMTSRTPRSSITGVNFTQLPGAGQQIAASPDGTFWVLSTQPVGGPDKYIYHYVGNGNYVNVPGAANRIAVGPDNTPWVVNSAGGIYHLVNGNFVGIAGGASDVSVGADGSVYVISNQGGGPYGRGIYHYVSGNWTQLPGAGVRVAASWDTGTYPNNIGPGGFYVLNAQGGIFYYYPPVGFTQIPGAALDVAPTTIGGVFVLGYPASSNGTQIFYDDLNSGVFTPQAGAGFSVSTNTNFVYVIGQGGGIFQSAVTIGPSLPPNFVQPNRSDGVTQIPATASNQFASSMLGASTDGTFVIQSTDTPGTPQGASFTLPEYTISANESSAGVQPSSSTRATQAAARESASVILPFHQRLDPRSTAMSTRFHGRSPLTVERGRSVQSVRRVSDYATGTTRTFHIQQGTITGVGGTCTPPKIKVGTECYVDRPSHLMYVSSHAYVWVDDAIDATYNFSQNDWVQTGTTMDNDFARETQAFAPAFLSANPTPTYQQCDSTGRPFPTQASYQPVPDLSGNDQHISILVTNALENTGEGGYFDLLSLLNDQEINCIPGLTPHVPSNNLPMFVVGTDKYQTSNGTLADENFWRTQDMPRTLPHEFQHYLHSLNKVLAVDFSGGSGQFDDSYVDEGDSMLAEDLVLGGAANPPQSPDTVLTAFDYLYSPGNFSLTAFAGYYIDPLSTSQTPTYGFFRYTSGNYGAAYLFARYLYDRFGQDAALHRLYADHTTAPASGANVYPIQAEANGESFAQVYGEFAAALAARNVASTDPRFRFGSNVLLRGSSVTTFPGGLTYNVVLNGPRSPQDLTSSTPQNQPRIKLTPGNSVSAKLITGATQFFNVAPAGGAVVSSTVTGAPASAINGALVQGAYDDRGSCVGPPANCQF